MYMVFIFSFELADYIVDYVLYILLKYKLYHEYILRNQLGDYL